VPRMVVAGASLAGLRVAEAARAAGFTGELVVIGDELYPPYNRPPLSKEALAGGIAPAALEFRRRPGISDVSWRLGVPVTAADLAARVLTLADGTALCFDGLAIATGLRPRRLRLPGPAEGRHVLRTIADAVALRADLAARPRVAVIGAGFVGCEVAATARMLGCHVEVIAPEDQPMQRPLGIAVGAALRRRHERRGVRFHLGRLPAVVAPARDDPARVGAVVLDDGTRVEATVVVEALGCLPATGWLRPGPGQAPALDLADGVRTDNRLRALDPAGQPVPGVVAAGDIARFPNPLYDEVPRRVEHWSIPTDTGKRAGATLAAWLRGEPPDTRPFTPMPSFWSDQYGERLQSYGAPGLADRVSVLEGDLDGEFIAGYERDGRLVGVAGIGMMPALLRFRSQMLSAALQRSA
jgi:3-phenylpropionate/trans-cinnamate dioxygenase ferredoxin reductase subunit